MEGTGMNAPQRSSIQEFNYSGKQVRVERINGEVWFVAKDVANILDFNDATHAIRGLDDDEKGLHKVETPGGMQDMTVISWSGLYTLILRSNKEEAKPFRRWVTHEVIPSIVETGAYITKEVYDEMVDKYQTLCEDLMSHVRNLTERIEKLESQPKASLTPPPKRRRTPTEAATELADLELLPRVKNLEETIDKARRWATGLEKRFTSANKRIDQVAYDLKSLYGKTGRMDEELANLRCLVASDNPNYPDCTRNITVGGLANVLTVGGRDIVTAYTLERWLRKHGYLSDDERTWNQPTYHSLSKDLFVLIPMQTNDPETGELITVDQTMCTPNGIQYFLDLRMYGESFDPDNED